MQLISIPANPVPEGATVGTVKTADGVVLRFARFEPPAGRKGTLCVCPGRTEFIEKSGANMVLLGCLSSPLSKFTGKKLA